MQIIIGNKKRNKKIVAGDGTYPKILASVGVSSKEDSIRTEVEKANLVRPIEYGADIVIDHTLTLENYEVQKRIIEETDIPISSIAVYDMAAKSRYGTRDFYDAKEVLGGVEKKAKLP